MRLLKLKSAVHLFAIVKFYSPTVIFHSSSLYI